MANSRGATRHNDYFAGSLPYEKDGLNYGYDFIVRYRLGA